MVLSGAAPGLDTVVVWHDLECGGYDADLPLWRDLAGRACAPGGDGVLDIGAGTGRVALALARAGHRVVAIDREPALLSALAERSGGLTVSSLLADARDFDLPTHEHCLCVVPMQTIQLLRGAGERVALMRCAQRHLRRGGLLAAAIVSAVEPFDTARGTLGPAPERARHGDRLYVSRPTRVEAGERFIRIERERYVADSPAGMEHDLIELERVTVAQLHDEGREAGFTPEQTLLIDQTEEHSASEVVVMRA